MTFWFSDKVKIQCVVFIAVLTPIILYISMNWPAELPLCISTLLSDLGLATSILVLSKSRFTFLATSC